MNEPGSSRTPVVDIHAHIAVPSFFEEAQPHSVFTGFGTRAAPALGRGGIMDVLTNQSAQLEDMDRRGIDISVISLTTVLQPVTWGDDRREAELCRIANNFLAEWVVKQPKRFRGAGTLPLSNRDNTLSELERCVEKLGMTAVQLPAQVAGVYLGERPFEYLWQELARRNVVAFMHPDGVKDPWFQNFRMWNSIGQSIEEAKFLSVMMYEGVFERHSDLRLVIAHGGGFLPHYMGRLDRNVKNMPETNEHIRKSPTEYLKGIYYDTCVYDPNVLDALIRFAGPDHILLGSDYPVGDADPVAVVSASSALDQTTLAAVLGGTATRLLNPSPLRGRG